MTTTNRYDEIIVRNRSNRVRDLAFGLVLAIVTAFAFASIESGSPAPPSGVRGIGDIAPGL